MKEGKTITNKYNYYDHIVIQAKPKIKYGNFIVSLQNQNYIHGEFKTERICKYYSKKLSGFPFR